MIDVSKLLIDKVYIKKIKKNVDSNKKIVEFYKRFAFEHQGKERMKFFNKADLVGNCNSVWHSVHYKKFNIKDFQKSWLCKDYKNCNNCKKVLQSARSMKWEKELEKFDDCLYHVIFTVPSCTGSELRNTIKKMEKAYKKFIRYISLDKLIKDLSHGIGFKNINLESFNFKGSLRSLEVAWFYDFKTKQYMYHPHFHCAFIFTENDIGEKFQLKNKNIKIDPYSFKRNDSKVYPFNSQEELFQRLWYLCYNSIENDIEINITNIDRVCDVRRKLKDSIMGKYKNVGYTVKIIKFAKGQYAELFKYMIKTVDFDKNPITYQVFKDLYNGLYKIKQLQGSGCFSSINDDVEEMKELIEDIYISKITEIQKFDEGVNISESIGEVAKSNSIYISKRKIYSYLVKEHKAEIKKNNKTNIKVYKLGDKIYKSQEEMFTAAYSLYKEFEKDKKNNLPKDTISTQRQITYL